MIEKGFISFNTKVKSFQQRYFRAKKKESKLMDDKKENIDCDEKY